MELAKKLDRHENGSPMVPVVILGGGMLSVGAAAWVGTLTQHSSETHKVISVGALWMWTRIPGFWEWAAEFISRSQISRALIRLVMLLALWLTFPLLLSRLLWAFTPEAVQIVQSIASLHLPIPGAFVWTVLATFVGVALASLIFRRGA